MKNGKQDVTKIDPSVSSNAAQTPVEQPQDAHLVWLPAEFLEPGIGHIGRYLSPENKYALSRTSYGLHTIFKQAASQHIHHFLTHVVRGEKVQVEAYLQRDPRLLLEKIQVTDEAGRKIYGTAFQIALGAKDVSPFPDKFGEMAEMIAAYFDNIPDGEVEKQKQYNEQFPEGFKKLEEERKTQDSAALNTVFAAIKNASTIASAKDAVEVFLNYLKAQTQQVIKTGYHFNEALHEEAFALYAKNYTACGGDMNDKNKLATVKVLGGIQRYFTANLAQSACDGFRKVVDEQKALSRSKLLADDVTSFFCSKLGVDHYAYSYYSGCGRSRWLTVGVLSYSKLMSNKNSSLGKLMQSHSAAKKPRCV